MKELLDDHIINTQVDLSRYTFRGKLAGISWKREQAISQINSTRKVIFLMSVLVFYPIIRNYINWGEFDSAWFMERLIYSIVLLLCGIFFHKFRLGSMIIAMLPILLIFLTYLLFISYFPLWILAFNLAILVLLAKGIYFHFKEKKLVALLWQKVREEHEEVVEIEET